MAVVELRDISVSYGANRVLDSVSLTLAQGEFVAVLGPSGCGKTTLLRVVAGFVEHSGTVSIAGQPCEGMPPHKRNIGIVFQDYALFPHRTVRENIGFGLRLRKLSRADIAAKLDELIALLQLHGLEDRYPSELSGGQRQRVAIARALAVDPQVLLLDEPLSALDKKLREEMQVELRQLQQRVGITTMFVTHDQEEALALADKIVVMDCGQIRQEGPPAEVYVRPRNRFVANFIGKSNIFEGSVIGQDGDATVCMIGDRHRVKVQKSDNLLAPASKIEFLVRPERIRLRSSAAAPAGEGEISGSVLHVVYLGAHQNVHIALDTGQIIEAEASHEHVWQPGETVAIGWRSEDALPLVDE
jgi:putative spermidine/putrescine transport system ATP-binding protein